MPSTCDELGHPGLKSLRPPTLIPVISLRAFSRSTSHLYVCDSFLFSNSLPQSIFCSLSNSPFTILPLSRYSLPIFIFLRFSVSSYFPSSILIFSLPLHEVAFKHVPDILIPHSILWMGSAFILWHPNSPLMTKIRVQTRKLVSWEIMAALWNARHYCGRKVDGRISTIEQDLVTTSRKSLKSLSGAESRKRTQVFARNKLPSRKESALAWRNKPLPSSWS